MKNYYNGKEVNVPVDDLESRFENRKEWKEEKRNEVEKMSKEDKEQAKAEMREDR